MCKLLLLALIPTPAFAYFDIGTGSYILQVIAASFLGIAYTIRHHLRVFMGKLMFWKKQESEIDTKLDEPHNPLNEETDKP